MKSYNLSEAELRQVCRTEIEIISRRVREGVLIPKPCSQLEKIYTPASAERAGTHLNRIKMLLKKFKSGSKTVKFRRTN